MIPVLAPKINRSDFTSLFNVNKNSFEWSCDGKVNDMKVDISY